MTQPQRGPGSHRPPAGAAAPATNGVADQTTARPTSGGALRRKSSSSGPGDATQQQQPGRAIVRSSSSAGAVAERAAAAAAAHRLRLSQQQSPPGGGRSAATAVPVSFGGANWGPQPSLPLERSSPPPPPQHPPPPLADHTAPLGSKGFDAAPPDVPEPPTHPPPPLPPSAPLLPQRQLPPPPPVSPLVVSPQDLSGVALLEWTELSFPSAEAPEALLGRGSYGVVLRASWRGVAVAVKELSQGGGRRAEGEFKREAAVLSAAAIHRNVVRLLGVVARQPRLAFVMGASRARSARRERSARSATARIGSIVLVITLHLFTAHLLHFTSLCNTRPLRPHLGATLCPIFALPQSSSSAEASTATSTTALTIMGPWR